MLIRFDPLDTLFFRDGRPYHQGENTQTNVLSRFPPSPTTLVGAIRAAWARALGWSGQGRWPEAIRARLGGDGAALGNGLRFRGPLLVDHCGSALFPLPASVLGREADVDGRPTDLTLLRPTAPKGATGFSCDLGTAVLLPAGPAAPTVEGVKVLEGWWVDTAGMARVLLGMVPTAGQVRPRKALWHIEPRVAIERNLATRTTGQGALYSPSQVRLQRGLTLAMLAEGLPQDVGLREHVQAAPQAVGGESRACWIEIAADPTDALFPRSPALAADGDGLRYAVHVVTPLVLETPPLPGLVIPGLPGELVSACLPRPQLWGGWDSIGCVPHALRPHLAPGSVLFMRAAAADTATVSGLHGKTIGGSASWGYGLIFIGTW